MCIGMDVVWFMIDTAIQHTPDWLSRRLRQSGGHASYVGLGIISVCAKMEVC